MIVCDSHISKRQLFVVRLSLQLQDKENRPVCSPLCVSPSCLFSWSLISHSWNLSFPCSTELTMWSLYILFIYRHSVHSIRTCNEWIVASFFLSWWFCIPFSLFSLRFPKAVWSCSLFFCLLITKYQQSHCTLSIDGYSLINNCLYYHRKGIKKLILTMSTPLVVIFMGSKSDLSHCEKIEQAVKVLCVSDPVTR